ncbi:TPA: hypothetical protein EYP44_01280 [Candidatus Bathyarchaeota archaeon]|nr:hypothetical protein [Candidatus Bathyarchaeota archaeon]
MREGAKLAVWACIDSLASLIVFIVLPWYLLASLVDLLPYANIYSPSRVRDILAYGGSLVVIAFVKAMGRTRPVLHAALKLATDLLFMGYLYWALGEFGVVSVPFEGLLLVVDISRCFWVMICLASLWGLLHAAETYSALAFGRRRLRG